MFDWFGWFDSEALASAKSKRDKYQNLLDDVTTKQNNIKNAITMDDIELYHRTYTSPLNEPEKTTGLKMSAIFSYASDIRKTLNEAINDIDTLKTEISSKVTYWENEVASVQADEARKKAEEEAKEKNGR